MNADKAAAELKWGIELETLLPRGVVSVGSYHQGNVVHEALGIRAPTFECLPWRAKYDSSLRGIDGHECCEFVSPIMSGHAGLECLHNFTFFADRIGAKTNQTCGCHVTVGIPPGQNVERFMHTLTRIVRDHQIAIYAQTGVGRHLTSYAAPLSKEVGQLTNDMLVDPVEQEFYDVEDTRRYRCGRGIVNLRKASGSDPCIEFRAFAGTLDIAVIFHHVATAFGLMRRAATLRHVPPFDRPDRKPLSDPVAALLRMWRFLGWEGSAGADMRYGLFGPLFDLYPTHSLVALTKAKEFASQFTFEPRTGGLVAREVAREDDGVPF